MTQYQLVAAAANVPATKLLGTSPKGFNATGEFEESSYHEELESIQAHDLTPLLDRHHLLVIRSEIAPKFGVEPFATTVAWNPLDSMTAKERAEVNKMEAETGAILVQSGAIDGIDERRRITQDPASGYTGIEEALPADPPGDDDGT
nr:anti-CBASS Acb1 family protein [Ralstonia syzygii]